MHVYHNIEKEKNYKFDGKRRKKMKISLKTSKQA